MKTITLKLDDEFHGRVLRMAAARGLTPEGYVRDLLASKLATADISAALRTEATAQHRLSIYARLTGRWTDAPAGEPFKDS